MEKYVWKIFPPPGNNDDYHKLITYSKRQHIKYSYTVGERVLMMVPSKRHTGGSGRYLRAGRIVEIKHGSYIVAKATGSASHAPRMDNAPGETLFTFDWRDQQRFLQPNMTLFKEHTVVLLVQETVPFRQLLQYQLYQDDLSEKDRVLEIGCSTGELSKRIWKTGVASWCGVDNSLEMVDKCSEQLERFKIQQQQHQKRDLANHKVIRMDPLTQPKRSYDEMVQCLSGTPTVVTVDIGGNREDLPVMELLSWVFRFASISSTADGQRKSTTRVTVNSSCSVSSPRQLRLIVVKSRALVRTLLQDSSDQKVTIESTTGAMSAGQAWFESTLARNHLGLGESRSFGRRKIKHPAKAPLIYSPIDDATPICRYHNYHPKGCKRRTYPACPCLYDHEHCHSCRKRGHRALDCPEDSSCY